MFNLGILRQILIGIVCNLLIIDSGMHEGWSTPIIPKFGKEDPLDVSTDTVVWVVNLMYVGVGLGSIVPFLLMDKFGRKGTLLFATIPKIASWLLIGNANSVFLLYVGRMLAGIGCGVTYTVLPMYLGEVSSKRSRGPLGTLMTVLLNTGMMISYAVGLWVSRFTMSMIAVSIPIIFLVTFIWLPETSVFLTKKNKLTSAERTLKWTLGKDDVVEELEEIKRIVATEEPTTKTTFHGSLKKALVRRENLRSFRIAMIVMSAMCLTGAAPLLAYQSFIFEEAGFDISTNVSIVMTGCTVVLAGTVCVMLVRILGKRLLLLFSTPVCLLSLATLAIFFGLLAGGHDVSKLRWMPTVCLVIYVFSYGLALNPVPIAYVGEIFHVDVKVLAAIICSLYYAVATTTVVKFYQVLQESYGTYLPITVFTAITFIMWILIYRYVPETEGKTLEEIQIELRRKR
ncbi:facilitated trehalose transporter Tret1-like isoform X1 [Hylaeus anthracinus]|uniref:facilitated trehalose transporter Tret1-like isoform X1 n=1 Tax=Hylaeus anthracinus TaxID=313031 RepID=UPI0023B8927E|nr:facilitated trehalose transporter Tret1-like isoform X1 [Hylaeus anthracinus]XP_054013332.1 facilitated trehalose transporter Tret1-like isoform X1 [Hylaeus anthracinus]XP_054013333.1 facilitated trehalose transporter Tret1-like isoform X1 [Hylaeus anthracinus]